MSGRQVHNEAGVMKFLNMSMFRGLRGDALLTAVADELNRLQFERHLPMPAECPPDFWTVGRNKYDQSSKWTMTILAVAGRLGLGNQVQGLRTNGVGITTLSKVITKYCADRWREKMDVPCCSFRKMFTNLVSSSVPHFSARWGARPESWSGLPMHTWSAR